MVTASAIKASNLIKIIPSREEHKQVHYITLMTDLYCDKNTDYKHGDIFYGQYTAQIALL